jgi:protease-4
VRYVERDMSAWERFALSFSDSEALVRLARYAGFSLPAGMFTSAEVRELTGLVGALDGRRYGAFAHCFCDVR